MTKKKRESQILILLILLIVMGVCTYKIYQMTTRYKEELTAHQEEMIYKPQTKEAEAADVTNESILEAQKVNEEIVGWLQIPDTNVDYLFTQATTNDKYLHRDIEEKYAYAGTLFIDSRNKNDFTDFQTVIYGHHMKNGSMFGDLDKVETQEYLEKNATAYIYLAHENITLDLFAYMIIDSDDQVIYNFQTYDASEEVTATDENITSDDVSEDTNQVVFLDYVKEKAKSYIDITAGENDRYVIFSTCNYDYKNARAVLIGRIREGERK